MEFTNKSRMALQGSHGEMLLLQAFPKIRWIAGGLGKEGGISALKPGDSLESLLKRADEALYQSKRNGRNRVSVSD